MAEPSGQFDINVFLGDLVKRNVEKLISGIHKVGTEQYNKLQIKTGLAFENYLSAGANKYGYTKTILYRDKTVPIYEFFVNMELECQGEVINTKDINNLLKKSKFTTILATGGSGKSTLFKHFFMNAITNTDLIPILVELRSLNDESIDLNDCIYKSLSDLKFDLEKDYFIQSLNSGRYLILLDGFDEVIDEKREKLIKDIISLTDKYDENYFILSSRQNNALYNGWSKSTDYKLLSLSKDKALELINNLKYNAEVKSNFLSDLSETLFDRHKSFCSNPLLLNLMLLTYEEFAEIPEKVHIFYARAFEVLYARHDGSKGLKRKLSTGQSLGYDEFVKILSSLSILSYLKSKISFDPTALKKYIEDAKKMTKIEGFNTEEYITDLVESICIFYLDGLNYSFQHRSFQEYFSAKFILNLPDKPQFDVISKLIEKRFASLDSDSVLDLIIEMDKQKFEKVFLIPMLREVKDYTKGRNKEETYLKYISSSFKNYGVDYGLLRVEEGFETLGDCVVFTHKTDDKKYYVELIDYIVKKYDGTYPFKKQSKDYKRVDIIEKYADEDDYIQAAFSVEIKKVTMYQELFEDFLLHSGHFIEEYNYAMDILSKLEEKHREQDNILDNLFGL
ncbi:NACHT domain-containing protein [Peribacillus frigoritolerans]|uniref:NACHT domain-containing protein n=1 Tax=Peribacillus frigoritolerans TaxID=450367 RepID=UPI003D02538A